MKKKSLEEIFKDLQLGDRVDMFCYFCRTTTDSSFLGKYPVEQVMGYYVQCKQCKGLRCYEEKQK